MNSDPSKQEWELITLLAMYDISGGNTEAELPENEILSYVEKNFDDLLNRVRGSVTKENNQDGG